MTADSQTMGFPPGYFVIRSVAAKRLLDVSMDDIEDGTEICLWPEKEKSLVESFRDPNANNQVFFVDTSGALCSRSAGHAIDIEGDRLVLRHRRPISNPFPNAYSHPLPQFSYSQTTGTISVRFSCDPAYPAPSDNPWTSQAWKSRSFQLASTPLRKPRTILDDASEFFSSAIRSPMSLLGGKSPVTPDAVFGGGIDLKEDEVVEAERGEELEVDDSPDLRRTVRMVEVEGDGELNDHARLRRTWVVIPLRMSKSKTGGI